MYFFINKVLKTALPAVCSSTQLPSSVLCSQAGQGPYACMAHYGNRAELPPSLPAWSLSGVKSHVSCPTDPRNKGEGGAIPPLGFEGPC